MKASTLLSLSIFLLLASPKVWSACTSPNGVAGTLDYFVATNVFKYCDGTTWKELGSPTETSAIESGWPDLLVCSEGTNTRYLYNEYKTGSGDVGYRSRDSGFVTNYRITFNSSKNYFSNANMGTSNCFNKSISTLISEGKAKFFGNDIAAVNSDDDGDTKIYTEQSADEDKIRFDTAGSERMIIDNAGKVGIATTDPVANLHVYGRGVFQTVTTYDEAQNVYDSIDVWGNVYGNNQDGAIAVHAQDSGDVARWSTRLAQKSNGSGSPRASIDVIQRDASNVVTSNTEALSILHQNGNIGVGTITPDQKFHVNGIQRIERNSNGRFLEFESTLLGGIAGRIDVNGASYNNLAITGNTSVTLGTETHSSAITIDSNGYVQAPNQVSFEVKDCSGTTNANNPIVWETVIHNEGSAYNNTTGVFTAPVAGVYQFGFNTLINNLGSGEYRYGFYKNGALNNIIIEQKASGVWKTIQGTMTTKLAASDTIRIQYNSGTGASYTDCNYNRFWGRLEN